MLLLTLRRVLAVRGRIGPRRQLASLQVEPKLGLELARRGHSEQRVDGARLLPWRQRHAALPR